jgi:hypothetical protein
MRDRRRIAPENQTMSRRGDRIEATNLVFILEVRADCLPAQCRYERGRLIAPSGRRRWNSIRKNHAAAVVWEQDRRPNDPTRVDARQSLQTTLERRTRTVPTTIAHPLGMSRNHTL